MSSTDALQLLLYDVPEMALPALTARSQVMPVASAIETASDLADLRRDGDATRYRPHGVAP
jgi:hypothetical protein